MPTVLSALTLSGVAKGKCVPLTCTNFKDLEGEEECCLAPARPHCFDFEVQYIHSPLCPIASIGYPEAGENLTWRFAQRGFIVSLHNQYHKLVLLTDPGHTSVD